MKRKNVLTTSLCLLLGFAFVALVGCDKKNSDVLQPINDAFEVFYEKDSTFYATSETDTIQVTKTTTYKGDTAMCITFQVQNGLTESLLMETEVQRYYISGANDYVIYSTDTTNVIESVSTSQVYPKYTVAENGNMEMKIYLTPTDAKKAGNYLLRYNFYLANISSNIVSVYVNFNYKVP